LLNGAWQSHTPYADIPIRNPVGSLKQNSASLKQTRRIKRGRSRWAAWNAIPRSYGLPASRASAKDDGRNGLGGESSLCTIRFLLH